MVASSDERSLAGALARLDDAALAHVLTLRGVSPDAPWHDFFDVAEALLAPASVDRALIGLPRPLLTALVDGRDDPGLLERMLRHPDGDGFAAVNARVRELTADLPHAAPTDDPRPADDAAVAAAAEHAFTAVASLTDLLLWTLVTPIARTGAGTVGVADRRRLVEAGAVADAEELEDLLAIAADAGLVRDLDRAWHATATAEHWVALPTPERWATVADAFVAALRPGLRTPDAGVLPPSAWADAYPLDAGWPQTAARLLTRAERLGVLAAGRTEPPWSARLRTTGSFELAALAPHLPAEIDRIYLQADLTAIAPGPLLPVIEQRLRTMAVRESRAQASTYRFSAESLAAAVATGETAESLRGFLGEVSLTGIPQPLAYLIDRAAARHGGLRVGVDPETGNTVVDGDDPDLLATVAVDQALRAVGLVAHGDRLVSRASRDAVYWSLFDARYPVIAVDHDGDPHALRRHGTSAADAAPTALERYAPLIAELRAHQGPDAEGAWLERELEQAVKTRAVVEVTVRLPDGTARTFQLEATGLGGGRLRGRDRGADVERTLPLSSIESARPV
ncbi:helicase-associated domain-containing protein [Microbacterium sp. GXF7504]